MNDAAAEYRIRELESQLSASLRERDGALKLAGIRADALVKAERERDGARAALKGMLLSMDAGWELDRAGHDWPEACEAARAALRVEVAPAEEPQDGSHEPEIGSGSISRPKDGSR